MYSKSEFKAILSTIPILKFKDFSAPPLELSLGCIINYKGFFFILTVAHSIESFDNKLAIHTGIKDNNQTVYIPLDPTFLKLFKIPNWIIFLRNFKIKFLNNILFNDKFFKKEDIDFAFHMIVHHNTPLPIHALHGSFLFGQKKEIVEYNFELKPIVNKLYTFYGIAKIAKNNISGLNGTETIISNAKFIDKILEGYYAFEVDYYKSGDYDGFSGTPIFDDNGNLISIFIKESNKYNNIILGLILPKYKSVLDTEIMNRTGIK